MRRTSLRGHALQHEGKPWHLGEEYPWLRVYGSPSGAALCECGAASPVLESDSARRRWHRDVHKPEVRARLAGLTGVTPEEQA